MTSRIGTKACLRRAHRGRQAFLLVEVMVTGVVMAAGVAMVSRSLAVPLHALTRLQQREQLLRLADSTLVRLETRALFDPPVRLRRGLLDPPHERYEWVLEVSGESEAAQQGLLEDCRAVAVTVREAGRPSSGVTLTSLWPRNWVEE